MKQGWEIKKIGEVAEVVGGSTPKTNEQSYWDGKHYWVTPAVLDGTNIYPLHQEQSQMQGLRVLIYNFCL